MIRRRCTLSKALLLWVGMVDGLGASRKTKVTDLEVAVGVEEQVGWFEIAVDDFSRVECFQSTAGLIEEVLAVIVTEVLSTYDPVQIRLEKFLDEVNFFERVVRDWLDDIEDRDDVLAHSLLGKILQQLELTQCAERKHGMVEWGDLLDGHLCTRGTVECRDDYTVCTLTNDIEDLVCGS